MNKRIRLNVYLEIIRKNVLTTTGELQEFWKREVAKTMRKIASL